MAADIVIVDSNFEIGKVVSGQEIQTRIALQKGRPTERDSLGEKVSLEASSPADHLNKVNAGERGGLILPKANKVDLHLLSKRDDPVGPEHYMTQGSSGIKPNSEYDCGSPKYFSQPDPNYEPDPVGKTSNSSTLSRKRGDILKAQARAQSWKRRARELKEPLKECPQPFTKEKKKRKGSEDLGFGVNQEEPISEKKLRLDNVSQGSADRGYAALHLLLVLVRLGLRLKFCAVGHPWLEYRVVVGAWCGCRGSILGEVLLTGVSPLCIFHWFWGVWVCFPIAIWSSGLQESSRFMQGTSRACLCLRRSQVICSQVFGLRLRSIIFCCGSGWRVTLQKTLQLVDLKEVRFCLGHSVGGIISTTAN
ncbi:hypothetical protein U1Q18_010094 [Sarracenia purpurea var. burkii]